MSSSKKLFRQARFAIAIEGPHRKLIANLAQLASDLLHTNRKLRKELAAAQKMSAALTLENDTLTRQLNQPGTLAHDFMTITGDIVR